LTLAYSAEGDRATSQAENVLDVDFDLLAAAYLQHAAVVYASSHRLPPRVRVIAGSSTSAQPTGDFWVPIDSNLQYSPETLEWRGPRHALISVLPRTQAVAKHWLALDADGYESWWKLADNRFGIGAKFD
jgi:hypothetical protein